MSYNFEAITLNSATVNGNITVTGTVDGIDIGTDLAKLDGTNTFTQLNVDNLTLDGNTISSTSGDININATGNIILNTEPTANNHAATKTYVDSIASGFRVKEPAVAKTTGNLTAARVGNVLTASTGNDIATDSALFDGVTLNVNDRVLVGSQTDPIDNGIYEVTTTTTNWTLTRTADSDGSPSNEVTEGLFVFITGGSTFADTGFVLTTFLGTVNTDPMTFTQSSAATSTTIANVGLGEGVFKTLNGSVNELRSLTAGSGITLTDNTNDVGIDVNQANITGTGALASGSITSGFGNIDNGTSGIKSSYFDYTPSTAPSVLKGRVYYDTTGDVLKYYDGNDWISLSTGIINSIVVPNFTSKVAQLSQGISYEPLASLNYSPPTYDEWKMYDNNVSTWWATNGFQANGTHLQSGNNLNVSGTPVYGEWNRLSMNFAVAVKDYRLLPVSANNERPNTWKIVYSNDAVTWTVAHAQDTAFDWNASPTTTDTGVIAFTSGNISCKYIALLVTSSINGTIAAINQIIYTGTPI